jgi:hypothetical protein
LIGIKVDLVFLNVEVAFYLREIQYTGQVEWIVDIKVDPE